MVHGPYFPFRSMSSTHPLRVAIIGGGCAALTTAFELTRPEHQGRFQVCVYQLGWRLGGKGASGRGPADRIEEHGLHLWMGFYENAFRLMRECYAELGRDKRTCRIATWREAFEPAPAVGLTDRTRSGGWQHWIASFPPGLGLPGDPLTGENPFTVRGYLVRAAQLLVELLRAARFQSGAHASPAEPRARGGWPAMPRSESVLEAIDRVLKYGQLATTAALLEAAELLRSALGSLFPHDRQQEGALGALLRLLEALSSAAHRQLATLTHADDELRRSWQVIDLVLAILRGSLRFGLALDPRGFDAIDDYDWCEWLRLNGAAEDSLDSGFVRGIYDLTFAYEGGDVRRRALSAGVALRGAMRMFFTYRGSLFWRMTSGMGDIVFAPLYEVLKRRGVAFHFFHRLRNVRLAEDQSPHVAALEFDVQALTKGGREYQPLVDVRGLPCWPARPDYSQLEQGEQLEQEGWAFESHWEERKATTRVLQVGQDFDLVVLGVGVAALPHVARELLEREPRWQRMVQHVRTVATQAFQVWLDADMRELGWKDQPVNLSGFVEPFDTWADMRHLLPEESWQEPPRAIAYFCSVLPDPASAEVQQQATWPHEERERVRGNAVRFLNQDIAALWPQAVRRPGEFRWELLHAEGEARAAEGEARFDTQYFTANVNPTDRYTLSLPGSSRHRLSPLDMAFDNLTVAGDWTESGLNSGCVESAVMSGMVAAHALSGSPRLGDIIGYDHP